MVHAPTVDGLADRGTAKRVVMTQLEIVGDCEAASLRPEGSGVLGQMKIKVVSAEFPIPEFHAIAKREFPSALIRPARNRFRARPAKVFCAKDFTDAKAEAGARQVAAVIAGIEIAV